jgi:hypothetical protein
MRAPTNDPEVGLRRELGGCLAVARKLAALAAALAACAPATKLTAVQVAPESPRPKVGNLLVVALAKDPAARSSYEGQLVKAIRATGAKAEASQGLLPIGAEPTREALQKLVDEHGFDGALVGMLVDARTEVRAVPPSGPYYSGFYGYTSWAAPMAYSPGYLETTRTIVVETRLFRTATSAAGAGPVFSATSESFDPRSVTEVTEPLAQLVVGQLRKAGFL